MTMAEAIRFLDESIPDKKVGLPDDIFYFISRTTPLVNVDLLIQDENGRTLLSWRDDEFCGTGWHIPGGIIRYKETFEHRIQKTAEKEFDIGVGFDPTPVNVAELIHESHENRGHFISFLYRCTLPSGYLPNNAGLCISNPGYLKWHKGCPDDLLKVHEIYRKYIDGNGR